MQQLKRHFSAVYGALYFFTELCEIKSNNWTEIERFKSEKITHRLHGQKRKKQQLHEIREHWKKRKKFFSILSLTSYYCSNLSFEGNSDVQSMYVCVCVSNIFFFDVWHFFYFLLNIWGVSGCAHRQKHNTGHLHNALLRKKRER